MLKKFKKRLQQLLILILMVVSIFFGYYYFKYKELVNTQPIFEVVEAIRSKENFITLDKIDDSFIKSLIATEDRRFYQRSGFDVRAFLRAIRNNIKAGQLVEGGSTIPQQLAKLMYFDHQQSLDEKIIQVFLMYDLESRLSKDEILELYINSIYYGSGYYGIYDASIGYFNKEPSELEYPESTLLVGVIAAPSAYDPSQHFEIAKERQKAVLQSIQDVYGLNDNEINKIYNSEIIIY